MHRFASVRQHPFDTLPKPTHPWPHGTACVLQASTPSASVPSIASIGALPYHRPPAGPPEGHPASTNTRWVCRLVCVQQTRKRSLHQRDCDGSDQPRGRSGRKSPMFNVRLSRFEYRSSFLHPTLEALSRKLTVHHRSQWSPPPSLHCAGSAALQVLRRIFSAAGQASSSSSCWRVAVRQFQVVAVLLDRIQSKSLKIHNLDGICL